MTDAAFHIETPRLYLSYFQPALDAHCDFLVQLYNTPEFIASIGGTPTSITTRAAAQRISKTGTSRSPLRPPQPPSPLLPLPARPRRPRLLPMRPPQLTLRQDQEFGA